jgi:hypothetical protein
MSVDTIQSPPPSSALPTLVVGDGWAAMSSVAFLVHAEKSVVWIAGTGARFVAPLPTLDASSPGVKVWESLARAYALEVGEPVTGSFLREFRNKAFREVPWAKAPTPEMRKDVLHEVLGEEERGLASSFECRLALTPAEIEEKIRARLADSPLVRRIEGVPVQEFGTSGLGRKEGRIAFARLANGEKLECENVIYADRWDALSRIEGLPKGLTFTKKRYAVGVLQAEFEHASPMAEGIQEGFLGALHKEAGENAERHIFGYFSGDGARSTWSLCIPPEEGEENHTIGKRLRRMKSALDKMFSGSGWLAGSYLENIRSERVRFEESVLYTAGEVPTKPIAISGISGIHFLTDGYGPTAALEQVALVLETFFERDEAGAQAHAENIDPSDADAR